MFLRYDSPTPTSRIETSPPPTPSGSNCSSVATNLDGVVCGADGILIAQSLNISSAGISISYRITICAFVVINHFRFSPSDAFISLTNVSVSSNLVVKDGGALTISSSSFIIGGNLSVDPESSLYLRNIEPSVIQGLTIFLAQFFSTFYS